MNNKEKRFEKLNNYLGYGNPDAKIFFIGQEEKVSWKLEQLIPADIQSEKKDEILAKILELGIKDIAEKVKVIKNEFNVDFDKIVDVQLDEYEKTLKNHIYACKPPKGKPLIEINGNTTSSQFKLSKEILTYLGKYNSTEDDKNYYNTKFGTEVGNEACLNFNPIARKSTNDEYDEEDYFFGESDGIIKRQEYFRKLFRIIEEKMNNEDIFIILMGDIAYKGLNELIGKVFKFDFSNKCKSESKFVYNNFEMIANKERNIWSVYHPTARGSYKFNEEKIKIVINEIKENYVQKEN